MTRRATRRTLLGALAGGLAGLAGCGYRPGGGEYRWSTGVLYRVDRATLDGGTLLLVTREAMSFDVRTDRWSDGGNVTTVDPERGERIDVYGFEAPTLSAALGADALYAGGEDGTVPAVPVGSQARDAPGTATPEPDGWTTATDVAPSGVDSLVASAGGANADSGTSADGGTDAVYAGGSGGLASLSVGGEVRWRWRDGRVLALAPGAGDVAVYALAPDRLVALADDGSVRWDRGTAPADVERERPVPPLVGADGVYLADEAGLTALARDGSVRWTREVGPPAGRPALSEDGLYHASADGVVRAFSLDGRERWAHDPRGGPTARVATADGRAFVLAGGDLLGVGPEGTVWRVPLDEPEPFDPAFGPFVAGETVVLAGSGEVRGYWRSQLRR